jgi:hypothetical protein
MDGERMRICYSCGKIMVLIDYSNTTKEEKHEYYCLSCESSETITSTEGGK